MPTAGAIWRLGTPSAASSTTRARLAARCGVVYARTRRSSSARSASVITSGGMVGMPAAPRRQDTSNHHMPTTNAELHRARALRVPQGVADEGRLLGNVPAGPGALWYAAQPDAPLAQLA